MSVLTLLYPVHTLDNRLLLPAGTVLSEETLDELISSSSTTSHETYCLLRYGSVKEDLLKFLSQPPYQGIFTDQQQISHLMNLTEGVHIVHPVLESLDYFRQQDLYTYRHILIVFALSTLLAEDLVSDYEIRIQEAAAGPSHDFGKVCVPIDILRKSDALTRTERGVLEHHSAAGYVLLSYYHQDTQNLTAKVARDHHERKDASGYPRGILLVDHMVEIVAVADVYDALISPRPYRPISYDNRTALEEITAMAEQNQIGWEVVRALVAHNRKAAPHYSECTLSAEKRGTPPPGNLHGVIAQEKS